MATFKLNYISRRELLKEVDLHILLQFLEPHKIYFENRGLPLFVHEGDEFNYDRLSAILMTPGDDVPRDLVDDLFYVDEMSTQSAMDLLMETLDTLSEDDVKLLNISEGATSTDMAMRFRTVKPDLLERVHAELYSRNLPQSRRSYRYFVCKKGEKTAKFNRPEETVLLKLEEMINLTLVKMKRGATAKVYIFERDDGVWVLVRHGMTCKREGTIDAGDSSSVYFRPETYDILKYDEKMGDLSVNAETEKLYSVYRQEVGRFFFGDPNFFPEDGKFTLEPLKTQGEDSILCEDIDGIDYVRLTEVQLSWGKELEIRRSDNLFSTSERWKSGLPEKPRIRQASFKLKFSNLKTTRTVKITPSNRASYTKDPNAPLVEKWLKARGFIISRETSDE